MGSMGCRKISTSSRSKGAKMVHESTGALKVGLHTGSCMRGTDMLIANIAVLILASASELD
eukprot:1153162-Pelagomonas_calceolata.AAC.4